MIDFKTWEEAESYAVRVHETDFTKLHLRMLPPLNYLKLVKDRL